MPTVYGQTYERTGALGKSTFWTRTGLTYRMESNAYSPEGKPYSEPVLGNASGQGQTMAFVGRWPNFAATAEKWARIAIQRMQKLLDALPGDFGL